MIYLEEIFDNRLNVSSGDVYFNGKPLEVRNRVMRFTPDESYSSGNFSALRERHSRLQFDSYNGTTDRRDTILSRTNWPADYFAGKLILECGCGAGPDTEILLSLGARVVSVDIAGCDVCRNNLGDNPNSLVIQASILDLPFKEGVFDIVWCHRVIQHTPDPEGVLRHILKFRKPSGAVFVHSYSASFRQMLSWKYILRPLARRLGQERLYFLVRKYCPSALAVSDWIRSIRPNKLGKILFYISEQIVPVRNYRYKEKFSRKGDDFILEYAIHDTFDALSPVYDAPLRPNVFREVAEEFRLSDVEVVEGSVTLLRSVVSKSSAVQ